MPRKPAPIMVSIDDTVIACEVIERMGFVHDVGAYAACVRHDGKEMMVVKNGSSWRPWTARNRVAPLIEGLARKATREHQERLMQAEKDL